MGVYSRQYGTHDSTVALLAVTDLRHLGLVHIVQVGIHRAVSYHLQQSTNGLKCCLSHLRSCIIHTLWCVCVCVCVCACACMQIVMVVHTLA